MLLLALAAYHSDHMAAPACGQCSSYFLASGCGTALSTLASRHAAASRVAQKEENAPQRKMRCSFLLFLLCCCYCISRLQVLPSRRSAVVSRWKDGAYGMPLLLCRRAGRLATCCLHWRACYRTLCVLLAFSLRSLFACRAACFGSFHTAGGCMGLAGRHMACHQTCLARRRLSLFMS